jgi:hypothetical protein
MTMKKFPPEIDAISTNEYLHNVVPSQHLVRREVMDAFEQSVARNRDLLHRLAK